MRTHLRRQAAPAPGRRVRPFPTLASLLYPQSFGLDMSEVHAHHVSPPPQPEWRVYSFHQHGKPVLIFSTQSTLHFPGNTQLDLGAKGDKSWDAGPWEAFYDVSEVTLSRLQNPKRKEENQQD
jgi:hypothetical protein